MSSTSLDIKCQDCGKSVNVEDIGKHECDFENDNEINTTSIKKEINTNTTELKVTKIGDKNVKQDSNESEDDMPAAQHTAKRETHTKLKSSNDKEFSGQNNDNFYKGKNISTAEESSCQEHKDAHEDRKSSPANDSSNQKQDDTHRDDRSSTNKESPGQNNEDRHKDQQNSHMSDEENVTSASYPQLSSDGLDGTSEVQRRASLPPNALMKDEPRQAWNANLQRRMSGKVEGPRPTKQYRHYPVSCEYCNKKFQPGRLTKHVQEQHPDEHLTQSMRGKGKISTEEEQEDSDKKKKKQGSMPRQMRICYICGRQYGSQSLKIHEPKCLEKWRIENEKLPKHKRMPEPVKPEPIKDADPSEKLPGSKGYDQKLPDLNPEAEAAYQSHLRNLVPCEFCSRTFNPDRVMVHENVCIERPGKRAKKTAGK